MDRLPYSPNHPSTQLEPGAVHPPNLLTKTLGALLTALMLAAIGVAVALGFVTFAVFFLLVVPALLLTIGIVYLLLRRGRINIYFDGSFRVRRK